MKRRLLGMAVVALAVAGMMSLTLYRVLRRSASAGTPALASVVAAAVPLQPGQPVGTGELRVVHLPAAALPVHVFTNPAQLQGKVLTVAAVPNQVIVGEMVAEPGAGVGLPPLIPPGMRAVSVKVNDVVSVAGFAVPGTHVDVLLTGNLNPNAGPRTVTTVTLLANVQVLTAGQQMEHDPSGKPEQVTVITLLVTPEGAEKLALADGYGRIQLALRNPMDQLHQETPPVLNAALYDVAPRRAAPRARTRTAVRAPNPAPATPWAVSVIVGQKQQRVVFPAVLAEGEGR